MSKGQKRKVTVKTMPGEAVFVASVDVLKHIAETYVYMSSQSSSKQEADSWIDVAEQINQWIQKTYHSESDYSDEEW